MTKEVAYRRGQYKERKVTLEKLAAFDTVMTKILNSAARSKAWCVPDGMIDIKTIKDVYGARSIEVLHEWLECKRLLNPEKLDLIDFWLSCGKITLERASELKTTYAYEPSWTVKKEKRKDAHAKVMNKLEKKDGQSS